VIEQRRRGTAKSYWRGTHRVVAPKETIERFGAHAVELGISRLANVTGLDYLGIPVFMAIRANSRSLSVSQGKGLDDWAAKASAFMEAAELEHAERIERPLKFASYASLRSRALVADPASLPRLKRSPFQADYEIPWIEGRDVSSGGKVWVPFELVHVDFSVPEPPGSGCFLASSNGLASGNHPLEALCAGLCEVIERDATSLWRARSFDARASRRLALDTITDSDCLAILNRLAERGIALAVWDATTDIGIACFLCRLRETPDNRYLKHGSFWGSGCHLSRSIALTRAITEAAQSRLTYIAGSRDDLRRRDYDEPGNQTIVDLALDAWERQTEGRRFEDIADVICDSFEGDLAHLLAALRAAGLTQVIAVDLTRARLGIPVMRIVVPGLEGIDEHSRYLRGKRSRSLSAAGK
jgi:YcaO-like protein with predicted kinase domain